VGEEAASRLGSAEELLEDEDLGVPLPDQPAYVEGIRNRGECVVGASGCRRVCHRFGLLGGAEL
jgi:hypothetical protein